MIKRWSGEIELEPIKHVYIHKKTGETYKSVTTTLTSIEPHFDAESISLAITKQLDHVKQPRYVGLTQQEILDFWQKLNDEANEYGTRVHDIIERYLLSNFWYFPKLDTDEGKFEQIVIDAFNELKIDYGQTVWPERILFSDRYKLAGMSDLIIDIDDVFFDVLDHKTNKKFSFYNEFGFQTLFPPFDHLQAAQFSIYNLQLSVYAYLYMLEFPKRRCRQIVVLYFDKETHKFQKINMPYLKNEAKQLVDMHFQNYLKAA